MAKRILIFSLFLGFIFLVGSNVAYARWDLKTRTDLGNPPYFDPIPGGNTQFVYEGDTLGFEVQAHDPEGGGLSLSIAGLPPNANFVDNGNGTGDFSFTPDYYQAVHSYKITFKATDEVDLTGQAKVTIIVLDVNQPPEIYPPLPATVSLKEGETFVDTVFARDLTDPERNLIYLYALGLPLEADFVAEPVKWRGILTFRPGYDFTHNYPDTSFQAFFFARDVGGLNSDTSLVAFVVENVNRPPQISGPSQREAAEGEDISFLLSVLDPDGDQVVLHASGMPSGATFDSLSGEFNWTPDYTQAGSYFVDFIAQDSGIPRLSDTLTTEIIVRNSNRPPVIEVCSDTTVMVEDTLTFLLLVLDPDPDDSLSVVAWELPQGADFNFDFQKREGEFFWASADTDTGEYQITFVCDDHQGEANSLDSAVVHISVIPRSTCFVLKIGSADVWPGEAEVHIPVYLTSCDYVGGYEILLTWDASLAELVDVVNRQSQEYFNYTVDVNQIRLVAISDLPNQSHTPPIPPGESQQLFDLVYNINSQIDGGYLSHLDFVTLECGDNTLSDTTGYIMWSTDENCPSTPPPYPNPHPNPSITLYGGTIYVDSPLKGDINLDGMPYTVPDAVLFMGYLLGEVHLSQPALQSAASDVNRDGIPWSIADLYLMMEVINGNIRPPKALSTEGEVNLFFSQGGGAADITLSSDVEVGGIYLVLKGVDLYGSPRLADELEGMELKYSLRGKELRVVIYSQEARTIEAGVRHILTLPLREGAMPRWEKVEISDCWGNLLKVTYTSTPDHFSLSQNYPNPFNSTTLISYHLSADRCRPTAVTLKVYNISGQLVKTLVNSCQSPGSYKVFWNGDDERGGKVGSGVYFYTLKVGDFKQTKRMVFLR